MVVKPGPIQSGNILPPPKIEAPLGALLADQSPGIGNLNDGGK